MKESSGVFKRPTALIVHAHLIRDVSHFNLNTSVIGRKRNIYIHILYQNSKINISCSYALLHVLPYW
jgi:hypothetical protein